MPPSADARLKKETKTPALIKTTSLHPKAGGKHMRESTPENFIFTWYDTLKFYRTRSLPSRRINTKTNTPELKD